jgi:hypothetical protein
MCPVMHQNDKCSLCPTTEPSQLPLSQRQIGHPRIIVKYLFLHSLSYFNDIKITREATNQEQL